MRYVFIALSLLGFFFLVTFHPLFWGKVLWTVPIGQGISISYALAGLLVIAVLGFAKLKFGK